MPGDLVDTINTATEVNPDLAAHPELTYALGSNPNLDGPTIGHVANYMDMYDTQHKSMKVAMGEDPQHSSAPGFFGDIGHIVDAAISPVKSVAKFVLDPEALASPQGLVSGIKEDIGGAEDIANRSANTIVEELSGGGARLNTNTGTFGLPKIEGENGKPATFDLLKGASDVFQFWNQLVGKAPGQVNGSALGNLVAETNSAAAAYKKEPNEANYKKASDLYNQVEPMIKAWNQNPNLQDAMQTVKNIGPINDIAGTNNPFFMMAHTAAYVESLAEKKGWAYALGQIAPSMAIGLLTDGALGADLTVGTEGYDQALIAEAARGGTLDAEDEAAVRAAQGRMDARQVQANFMQKETDLAYTKFQDRIAGAGSIRRGLYNVGDEAALALKPIGSALRYAASPARSLPLNVMYQMVARAAQSNPEDAALWNQAASYQVYNKDGKPIGQDGTALLSMLDLDPKAIYFSPLSDIADVANFYTKWLGADPLGVAGDIIGKSRTFEGLRGTFLGRYFSGLGITSTDDMYRAFRQYPRVAAAVRKLASSSAGQIADRFVGTFTARQAVDLGKLTTDDEVIRYLGAAAEANQLIKPLAPTWSAFDAFKSALQNDDGLGGKLHLTGEMTPQGMRFLLENGTDEQLARRGIYRSDAGSLAANPDIEIASTASMGRWLATRLGRNPVNAVDIVDRGSQYLNPLSVDFSSRVGDLARVALYSENEVKAFEEIAVSSTYQERINLYRNLAAHTAQRRIWSGLDKWYVALMKPMVDRSIMQNVINQIGVDGGGEFNTGTQMIAGEEGVDLTPTYDPADPGADAVASAARLGQTGHLKLFRPAELKGLGVYAKRLLLDPSSDLVSRARFYQESTEDIEKLAQYTDANLGDVRPRITKLVDKIPADIGGVQERAGFRAAVGTIAEQIEHYASTNPEDDVKAYVDAFTKASEQIKNLETLDALNVQRRMLLDNSDRLNDPNVTQGIAALDKNIPSGFGIKSLNELNTTVERRLQGMLAGARAAGTVFTDQLADDSMWYDDIKDVYDKWARNVADNPDALANLNADWDERLQRIKAGPANPNGLEKFFDKIGLVKLGHPDFLSWYGHKVVQLNHLLNRTWVPAALFSGAWAFHITVSESSLNTLRNGFLPTLDSAIARNIVKHASANPTDTYFGGLVSDIKAKMIPGFKMSDLDSDALKHDEGAFLARTTAKALHGAFNILRDTAAGTTLGFERLALSGMDDAARERMIGDFTDQIYMHDGHLYKNNPLKIDHTSSTFQGAAMEVAHKQQVWGLDENRMPSRSTVYIDRTFRMMGVNEPGYATGLSQWMKQIAGDPVEAPVAKELYRRLYAAGAEGGGTEEEIVARGASHFRTEEEFQKLQQQVEDFTYGHIKTLSPEIRERMGRDTRLLDPDVAPKDAEGNVYADPHRHWAKALRADVFGTVSGKDEELASGALSKVRNERIIHASLVRQVANDDVKEGSELADDIRGMNKGTEPKYIPARHFTDATLRNSVLASGQFMTALSDWGHHSVFGPIANNLVRDPLYLLSYHQEMESLRLLGPTLSETEMQTIAENRAAGSMIRFVHNPLDKMIIEKNLRVVAPFYFAQNQALRRGMRLLTSDPGAFERYLKLSLGVTNLVSSSTKNGEQPYLQIPLSQVIGKIASLPNSLLKNVAGNVFFDALDFGLQGSPGSVSSMFPTGAIDSFSGIAGNLVRPSGGPIENVLGLMLEGIAAHVPWMGEKAQRVLEQYVNETVKGALGPQGAESTFGNQVDPSSVFRNTGQLITAIAQWIGGANINPGPKIMQSAEGSTTILSSLLLVMNDAADTFYKTHVNDFIQKYQKENGYTAEQMQQAMKTGKFAREVSGIVSGEFATYLQNHQDEFLSSALSTNVTLMAQKALWSLISPLSPGVNQTFSKSQDFDNLLTEKKPDGSLKYTYDEARSIYQADHPSNVLDLTARSFDTFGPWPETEQTLNFVTKYPKLVNQYPYALAFLMNPDKPYYGPAFDTLINQGLRSRDTPKDFIQAMLVQSGQMYYKHVLSKEYPNNSKGWGPLAQAAAVYGTTSNPTWGLYHTGKLYGYQGHASLDQMAEMVKPGSGVTNSMFGNGNAADGAVIRSSYKSLVDLTRREVRKYENTSGTSAKDDVANKWYERVQSMIKVPGNAPYVTFMENVMQDAISSIKPT